MSDTAEFGGPSTVALNQSAALSARGHDVTLISGSFDTIPPAEDHVAPRVYKFRAYSLVRRKNLTLLWSPTMIRWIQLNVRNFDVVHIHMARDFITLPAALAIPRSIPLLVQTHGMINPRKTVGPRIVDKIFTLRILARSCLAFALTDRERGLLRHVLGDIDLEIEELKNGVPFAPVCTQHTNSTPEVLFLARINNRKRPDLFVQAAAELLRDPTIEASFTIIGPPGGCETQIDELIADWRAHTDRPSTTVNRQPPIPPSSVAERMAKATVYVLPSINEPYPMTVIEAMIQARPVIVTRTCGLAPLILQFSAGLVIEDDSLTGLADAIKYCLEHPAEAARMGDNGRRCALRNLSMDAVVQQLEQAYGAVI